jgi:hypothetical protein
MRVGQGGNVVRMTSAQCTRRRGARPTHATGRCVAYILAALMFLASPAAAQSTPPAVDSAKAPPPAAGALRPSGRAEMRTAPDGSVIGTIVGEGTVVPLARERGWVRVRMEGWVRETSLLPIDAALSTGLSAADLRADPAEAKGKLVRWTVEVLALQRADALRRDLAPGEPYLLARGPSGENAMLYLALPAALVNDAKAITPLSVVQIVARVRNGRSAPTNVPILDIESIAKP